MSGSAPSAMHKWIMSSLEKYTGHVVSMDIINYMLLVDNEADLREFVNGMLPPPMDKEKKAFVNELVRKVDFEARERQRDPNLTVASYRIYNKADTERDGKTKNNSTKSNSKNKQRNRGDPNSSNGSQNDNGVAPDGDQHHKSGTTTAKYVPLYDSRGAQSVILIPGRHLCDCQASRHKLIRNCLSCGRIVCEQERSGPCLFCGNLVATREEMDAMKRCTQKGKKIYQYIMRTHNQYLDTKGMPNVDTELPEDGLPKGPIFGTNQKKSLPTTTLDIITSTFGQSEICGDEEPSSDEKKATEFKDRLLNYDRTASKRTQVIDDESDYFSSNLWETPEERARIQNKEQRLRDAKKEEQRNRTVTIDIMGQKIVESINNLSIYERAKLEDELSQQIKTTNSTKEILTNNPTQFPAVSNTEFVAPPQFVGVGGFANEQLKESYLSAVKDNLSKGLKLQDSFLQEMTDQGVCLSMHQPWASLLVAGIKRHEGRDWYTTHRGRLWIASTAKTPAFEDIEQVEQTYKIIRNDDFVQFPKEYPTGCLLGCIDVVECLTHEQYSEKFSAEFLECNDSSYVWICENPMEIEYKFPVIGKPKIWKLDADKHKAAKKTLKL